MNDRLKSSEDDDNQSKATVNLRSKLDLMWKELQSNLPEVDLDTDGLVKDSRFDEFDDEEENVLVDEEDEFVLVEKNAKEDDSDLLNGYLNKNLEHANIDEDENDDDQDVIGGLATNDNDDVIISSAASYLEPRIASGSMTLSPRNQKNVTSEASAAAAKITRNLFESTNTKLSMDIFDKINIDRLLDTVNGVKTSSVNKSSEFINSQQRALEKSTKSQKSSSIFDQTGSTNESSSPRYLCKDENILKKLAEMSKQISEKSAAATNKQTPIEDEEEDLDKKITNDLNKFLKQHNVVDGNIVETKRLDLRSSQTTPNTKQQYIYTKPTIESIFRNMVIKEDDEELFKRQKELGTFRFLNEQDGDDDEESSTDSDDANDDLWIERYRKQKAVERN